MKSAPLVSQLALLQLSDSAFPAGTFAHSYGLEQLARERIVRTPDDVGRFVGSILNQTVATSDAPASYQAAMAVGAGEIHQVIAVDRALYRMKAAEELRTAALSTGRRLLEETALYVRHSVICEYVGAVEREATLGVYPVAFGAVSASLGVPPEDVPGALMFGSLNAMLQAAMRLLAFSHRDAQALLHAFRLEIAEHARSITSGAEPRSLASFHPIQEIASMRHAAAEARLFIS